MKNIIEYVTESKTTVYSIWNQLLRQCYKFRSSSNNSNEVTEYLDKVIEFLENSTKKSMKISYDKD